MYIDVSTFLLLMVVVLIACSIFTLLVWLPHSHTLHLILVCSTNHAHYYAHEIIHGLLPYVYATFAPVAQSYPTICGLLLTALLVVAHAVAT